MLLDKIVSVDGRFQRSVNIQFDNFANGFFEGFKAPLSSEYILERTCSHSSESNHNSFTWTGPYGSGKSSLALALETMTLGQKNAYEAVENCFSKGFPARVLKLLAPKFSKRRCINIVGTTINPEHMFREHLKRYSKMSEDQFSDASIIEILEEVYSTKVDEDDGIIVFVDEMGKCLESASKGNGDVYLFQEIAELANRSDGRFIFIGILHQSFAEYAGRLSQESKREWSKIEGRFIDLSLNVSGEEQIELIARAIQCADGGSCSTTAKIVANEIIRRRPGTSSGMASLLARCWPLHPGVTALLGPLSRRSYGQNQRSIFGFLNSQEPSSFQQFLKVAHKSDLYAVSDLWDYMKQNLDQSIYHSSDGHKWATHSEAVDRCLSLHEEPKYLKLIKAISVLDLFKEQSGLYPTKPILESLRIFQDSKDLDFALESLEAKSLIVYRTFNESFSIFAGSDFDIETEIAKELANVTNEEAEMSLEFSPIMAKRHYHRTGTSRWFTTKLLTSVEALQAAPEEIERTKLAGGFILTNDTPIIRDFVSKNDGSNGETSRLIFGFTVLTDSLLSLAKESLALKNILLQNPKLLGDEVGRREVEERLSFLAIELGAKKEMLLTKANWHHGGNDLGTMSMKALNQYASKVCDNIYNKTIVLKNELLNRKKPSSTARAAQNELIRRILTRRNEPLLGMTSYSADRGIFESLILDKGIFLEGGGFADPRKKEIFSSYEELWIATDGFIKSNEGKAVSVTEIYDFWAKEPFGISHGLFTLLLILYCSTSRDNLIIYRDELFLSEFLESDGLLVANNPKSYSLKWIELGSKEKRFMLNLANLMVTLHGHNEVIEVNPLEIGRAIVSWFDGLHPLTQRTLRLSKETLKVRDVLKNANDPSKLIFSDFRSLVSKEGTLEELSAVFQELNEDYSSKIDKLSGLMLDALGVQNDKPASLAELRARAANIRGLKDKSNLGPFILKLSSYSGEFKDKEFLASFAAGKPTTMWYDGDYDKAQLALVELAQQFNKLEAYSYLENRPPLRRGITILQTTDNGAPISIDFSTLETDTGRIQKLTDEIVSLLDGKDNENTNVILSALAKVTEEYIRQMPSVLRADGENGDDK